MTITSAIVLYAVVWFMTFFVVLPIRTQSQDEANNVEPGTPPGAPAQEIVGKKAKLTTLIATPIWAAIAGVILSGWISIADLDWFGRLGP
jgi:predicted secreted protein